MSEPKEKKKMARFREIKVLMPEAVVEFLELIKKPELGLGETIAEIVYKEVKAYAVAQEIIEKESKEPVKVPILVKNEQIVGLDGKPIESEKEGTK